MNTETSEPIAPRSILQRISDARAVLEGVEDDLRSFRPVGSYAHGRAATEPVALARAVYAARRARDRHFGADLFADPAWDLLLDLYVSHFERRAVSTSSACIAAAVPPTTALRWIDKLEAAGLLFRRPVPGDHRMIHLDLTPDAIERMTDLLVKLGSTAQL